jgi:hypothetical protein
MFPLVFSAVESIGAESVAHHRIDIVAIFGIIGTLAGTLVGTGATLWIQTTQRRYQDRTRFHERRLNIYADFTGACNVLIGNLDNPATQFDEKLGGVVRTYELVRLVASPPVWAAAMRVHSSILTIIKTRSKVGDEDWVRFNAEMAALCNAIRTELGTATSL